MSVNEKFETPNHHEISLALSGGGIRSASFSSGVLAGLLGIEPGEVLGKGDVPVASNPEEISLSSISTVSGGGFLGSSFIDFEAQNAGPKNKIRRVEFFRNFKKNIGYLLDLNCLECCTAEGIGQWCLSFLRFWEGLASLLFFVLGVIILFFTSVLPFSFLAANFFEVILNAIYSHPSDDMIRDFFLIVVLVTAVISAICFGLHISIRLFKFKVMSSILTRYICDFLKSISFSFGYLTLVSVGTLSQQLLNQYINIGISISALNSFTVVIMFIGKFLLSQYISRMRSVNWMEQILVMYMHSIVIRSRLYTKNEDSTHVFFGPILKFLDLKNLTSWKIWMSLAVIGLIINPIITYMKHNWFHIYYRWRLQKAFYAYGNFENQRCDTICSSPAVLLSFFFSTCPNWYPYGGSSFGSLSSKYVPTYFCNTTAQRWNFGRENYKIFTLTHEPNSSDTVAYAFHSGDNQVIKKTKIRNMYIGEAMAISGAAITGHMGKLGSLRSWLNLSGLGLNRWLCCHTIDSWYRLVLEVAIVFIGWFLLIILCIVGSILLLLCPNDHCLSSSQVTFSILFIAIFVAIILHPLFSFLGSNCRLDGMCDNLPFIRSFRDAAYLKHYTDNVPPDLTLTDGGHSENLGAYIYLQQKRKNIVIVDAEEDPSLKCDGLMYLLEMARKNLKCKFSIDSNGSADVEHELMEFTSRKRDMVFIFYVKYPGIDDWYPIIYIKPKDLGQRYRQRCCPHLCCFLEYAKWVPKLGYFPHISTGIQFFTHGLFDEFYYLGHEASQEVIGKLQHQSTFIGDNLMVDKEEY